MNRELMEQMFVARGVKTSVLLWELLSRGRIGAVLVRRNDGDILLFEDKDGIWHEQEMKQ